MARFSNQLYKSDYCLNKKVVIQSSMYNLQKLKKRVGFRKDYISV